MLFDWNLKASVWYIYTVIPVVKGSLYRWLCFVWLETKMLVTKVKSTCVIYIYVDCKHLCDIYTSILHLRTVTKDEIIARPLTQSKWNDNMHHLTNVHSFISAYWSFTRQTASVSKSVALRRTIGLYIYFSPWSIWRREWQPPWGR